MLKFSYCLKARKIFSFFFYILSAFLGCIEINICGNSLYSSENTKQKYCSNLYFKSTRCVIKYSHVLLK